ncbi:MAG: hypothetical protein LQ351_001203 [Letrouitia transgressa]|nr:MAG: hypothetical protein LQ351_001203 [Letrouitia transgressa]
MKILEPQSATLSNSEVQAHLSHLLSPAQQSPTKNPPHPILNTLHTFLSPYPINPSLPASQQPPPLSNERLRETVKGLKSKGLEKGEVIMCVNVRPQGEGPLSSVVEEMEERLGEEGIQEVLRIVDGTEVEGKGKEGEEGG